MTPATTIYNTGDRVPSSGTYKTVCCNSTQALNQGNNFPPCPACQLAASWKPQT